MYDVIVVGARCAGAPLAMLLARAGHRVALVDRASVPSDTMSTHFLWQRGGAWLRAWGLLDQLRDAGCEPIERITVDFGNDRVITGTGPPVGGVAEMYCPRRFVLDAILARAAVAAGADLIEGYSVRDVLWSEGRAAGVIGRDGNGGTRAIRAKVVVGADGLRSAIARSVRARDYRRVPSRTAVYFSYWSGLGKVPATFHARPGQLILVWPTNDRLTCVYVAWPRSEFSQVRLDVDRRFHSALGLIPGLREAVSAGRREQRFSGTGDLPSYYRVCAGPGWALAGDAGHHKDPGAGMGMPDAFGTADLLAGAIHDGLSGSRPLDQALTSYQAERDALTAGSFRLSLATARLAPLSPRLDSFYLAASQRPDLARQVLGVLGGAIPIDDVYPPKSAQRAGGLKQ